MSPSLPVWRSLLYVPITVDKFVDKAHTRGADAIQLDLEDSVPPAEKARARTLIEAAAAKVGRHGADVVVRINRPLDLAVRDLEAAVCPAVGAIAVTKVDSAAHVRLLSELVADLERRRGMAVGRTKFIAMVETADAFFRLPEIAKADARVVALNLGTEDFATSAGMAPEADGLLYPKQQIVFAARAAGILPLGFVGTVAGIRDLDGFRAMVHRARHLGFEGAACIHPDHVPILNEGFTPPADDVVKARRIVAANAEHEAKGLGAFELDGRMIDAPVVQRAQRLLARLEAIRKRQGTGKSVPI